MDWVELRDFELQCVVGILARERVAPQRLSVHLRMGVDFGPVSSGDLSLGVNYADVADELVFIIGEGRWRLIEAMGVAICEHLLLRPGQQRGAIEAVELALHKPEILGGLATPGVRLSRLNPVNPSAWSDREAGVSERLLHEVAEVRLARLRVSPGAVISLNADRSYWQIGVGKRASASTWLNSTDEVAHLIELTAREWAVRC